MNNALLSFSERYELPVELKITESAVGCFRSGGLGIWSVKTSNLSSSQIFFGDLRSQGLEVRGQGQGFVVQGQLDKDFKLVLEYFFDFPRGQQHWVTVKNGLLTGIISVSNI